MIELGMSEDAQPPAHSPPPPSHDSNFGKVVQTLLEKILDLPGNRVLALADKHFPESGTT